MKKRKKLLIIILLGVFSSIVQAQYMFYGTTATGGAYNKGTIFNYNPKTNVETVLFSFDGSNGNEPESKLLYASDSLLYGTTNLGGVLNRGTVFSFNWKTNMENVAIYYDSLNGYRNAGGNELIQAKNGLLYGTSWEGGTYDRGVLYSYNIITKRDSVLYNFGDSVSGVIPFMALWEDTLSGILYGVNDLGGKLNGGVLHGYNTLSNKDSAYVSFKWQDTSAPSEPSCTLLKASNGLLYGMSFVGGDSNFGSIYTFNTITGAMNTVFQFNQIDGAYPDGNGLIQLSNGLIYGTTDLGGSANGGVLFSFNPVNNSENVLVNFNNASGANPVEYLVQDPDNGLLYGITNYGGSANMGVLYSFDTGTSTYTKLIDFTGTNGAYPTGLTLIYDTLISTGANKINASASVRIYPNPSNGQFTLSLSNIKEKCQVEIYNVLGEKVTSEELRAKSEELNLSSQPNGIYLYRVVKEDGGLVGEGKVVLLR